MSSHSKLRTTSFEKRNVFSTKMCALTRSDIFDLRSHIQRTSTSVWGAIAIAVLTVSVSHAPLLGQASREKSLYDRLGGKVAITAVADEFVGRAAADERRSVQLLGVLGPMKAAIVEKQ